MAIDTGQVQVTMGGEFSNTYQYPTYYQPRPYYYYPYPVVTSPQITEDAIRRIVREEIDAAIKRLVGRAGS